MCIRSYLERQRCLLPLCDKMILFYVFLFILGLIVGSFLGVVIFRLPRGLTLGGRSFCDHCKKVIPWRQNIPLFYFLYSGGRCAICKGRVSPVYPFVEALTGASFVLLGFLWFEAPGLGPASTIGRSLGFLYFPLLLALVSAFVAFTFIDWEFQILPDELLLSVGAIVALVLLSLPSPSLFVNLFWGFATFAFFLVIYLLTRGRGMGFGDVKLSFLLGSLLGFPQVLVFLFLSFLTGAASGIVLVFLGRAKFGKPVPFGPYLLGSSLASLFYGEMIFNWYMGLL